jgi:hypothetical protein
LKNAARKTALNERGGDGGDLARFDEIRRAPAPGVGGSGVVDGRVGVGEGGLMRVAWSRGWGNFLTGRRRRLLKGLSAVVGSRPMR